jgi:uncharacterized iron-regulated membrane protein
MRRVSLNVHRWLGVGAALFWIVQALTGLLLSFHFELEDAALSTARVATDPVAIERRIDTVNAGGGQSRVNWIWTTAGLPDRYVINFTDPAGAERRARIDGAGNVLRDREADDHSFFTLMRAIHIDLLAGDVGHWISAITGILLFTNILFGIFLAWPRRSRWREALTPIRKGGTLARYFSWHRSVGLWAAIPALVIAGTGSLILFEHEIGHVLGVEEVALPANPPAGTKIGFPAAHRAAIDAIPGSRFVAATMPSADDASYYAWVRAPGELYRGGYGGSLVVVDANDASIRGAWPATEHEAARMFLYALYPLHTGEAAGLIGRILAMLVGAWLLSTITLGLLLWWRRRPAARTGARRGNESAGPAPRNAL